jgi:hypothetical protein
MDANMPPTSIYSPLEHRNEIRLLRIEPKSGGGCINITLETYGLDSDVQFTALSYVWGNPTPQFKIVCNGHRVPIGQNLLAVLSRLQEQRYNGLLWVDAICIYSHRSSIKPCRNLRLRPQLCEVSDPTLRICNLEIYRTKSHSPNSHPCFRNCASFSLCRRCRLGSQE